MLLQESDVKYAFFVTIWIWIWIWMKERDVYCGSLEVAESHVTLRLTALRCSIMTMPKCRVRGASSSKVVYNNIRRSYFRVCQE